MSRWQTKEGRINAKTLILRHICHANNALIPKSSAKDVARIGYRNIDKILMQRTGKRVDKLPFFAIALGLASAFCRIVKEGTELRPALLGRDICHHL